MSVPSEVSQIQTEIMTNGPVEAAFTVYADFPSYKKGTQRHRLHHSVCRGLPIEKDRISNRLCQPIRANHKCEKQPYPPLE